MKMTCATCFWQLIASYNDNRSSGIQTSSTCSSSHLGILSRFKRSEVVPVVFSNMGKHDTFRGHVDAHRECFGCKQYLDETS